MVICCSLAPDHEAVKCLSAFGEKAQKFAAEVLATIEGGTQEWKLQEPFPVPLVPRWLRTPEFMQTMMPLRGELPLIPTGTHYEDIHVRCPAVWAWMAVFLQYWQDHMTCHLYGGRFHQTSDLATILISDINPWLPHKSRFGWGYVAMHATLWLDLQDLFVDKHVEKWEAQKSWTCALNDLEQDTEVIYRTRTRRTRHSQTAKKWPPRSCRPNNRSLVQEGRQAPCLERKTCPPRPWAPPSTPTGS